MGAKRAKRMGDWSPLYHDQSRKRGDSALTRSKAFVAKKAKRKQEQDRQREAMR